jgi:hypothetical protein
MDRDDRIGRRHPRDHRRRRQNLDDLVLLSDAFTGATTTAPVFGLPPGAVSLA